MTRSSPSMYRTVVPALSMMIGLALSWPDVTLATDLPVVGNKGGNYFRAECPKGSYLIGLQGRAGAWVDRIQTLCAPWLHAEQSFGPASVGRSFGDSRGGTSAFGDCADGNIKNRAIRSWSVKTIVSSENWFVNRVTAQCISLGRPAPPSSFVFGSASEPSTGGLIPFPQYGESPCPTGEIATGIHGRAGLFLDAVGLICGPFPPPKPPIAATRVNPNAKASTPPSPSTFSQPSPQQGGSATTQMKRSSSMIMPRGIEEKNAGDTPPEAEKKP